jgi:hypothetical protein
MTPKGIVFRGIVASILLLVLAACATNKPEEVQTLLTLEDIAKLTPEQIGNMDEAELKAINQKLEGEFEKAETSLLRASRDMNISALDTAQKWPNYDLTLFNAVTISAETYLSSVRFSYAGPEWKSDSCTGVPNNPLGFPFDNACIHHDFGYQNVPKYARGRTEEVRQLIDTRFLGNMRSVCARYSVFSSSRYSCNVLAYTYYAGVQQLAKDVYYSRPVLFN